ncbi:hypothetical protein FACS189459_0050 [Bacilli bacterium]|nr:hypothetical protein FACS189459_0050 [Bacilli bacterium]GHU51977.1 hypothetical protein FACS189496_1290 [Bacilli bacterium]
MCKNNNYLLHCRDRNDDYLLNESINYKLDGIITNDNDLLEFKSSLIKIINIF